MTATLVTAAIAAAGMLAGLGRVIYLLGMLVQRFGDHVENADRVHSDHEVRIRALERRPSGGHF